MRVILKCIDDIVLQTSTYEDKFIEISTGDEIVANFTEFGVKFLLNNVWSFPFEYEVAETRFKVKGQ